MLIQRVALVLIAVLVVAAGAVAAQPWYIWGRWEVQMAVPRTVYGAAEPRYQVMTVPDKNNPATCLVIILDTASQHFTTTAVDPASCRPGGM